MADLASVEDDEHDEEMRSVEQGGGTTLESLCAGLQRSDVQVTSFQPPDA